MYAQLKISDFRSVFHFCGKALTLFAYLLLVPIICAFILGEFDCAINFLISFGLILIIGLLLRLIKPVKMTKKRSYLLVVLTWLMLCIVGAIPLFVTGSYNSIVDALFDSVSAITTTGTSLCSDVDHAPLSLSIFRSILSLAGAQCVIITFIYAGFHGEGSFLSKSQAFQNVDKSKLSLEFSMRPFLLIVTIVSIGSSAIAAIILFAGGMPIDQAIPNGIVVALSAFSTSSFAPHSSNLVFYQSSILNNFLAIVMLIGSINFVIYFKAIDNNFKSIFTNKELRIFLIWIVILTIAVTIVLTTNYDTNNWLFYVNSGLVMVVSAATTCGMQTIYPSTLTSVPYAEILIALCLASIVGGLIYSATGGVKVFRMVEMFKAVALSIKQKLVPANVYVKSEIKFSKSQSDFSKLGSFTLIIILLYLISAGTGALAFIIHGNAALPSLLESISYVSNTGFNTGISNINMSIDLKFICMFLMLIARLEFICVFACIFIIITGIISTIKNRFKKTNRKPNKTIAKYVSVILILALCINSSYICYAQAQENDSLDKSSNVSSSAEATFDPQIYSETTILDALTIKKKDDGKKVKISGELISGAFFCDTETSWVNIYSSNHSINVLVKNEELKKIINYGSYKMTGDIVNVYGTLNYNCDAHSGQLEVHCDNLELVTLGQIINKTTSFYKIITAIILSIIAIVLNIMVIRASKRRPYLKFKIFK